RLFLNRIDGKIFYCYETVFMRICSFLFSLTTLFSQEEIAKTNFPILLTPEEQEASQNPSPCCNAPSGSCCPSLEPVCPDPCCEPPSLICPPITPRYNPCDC